MNIFLNVLSSKSLNLQIKFLSYTNIKSNFIHWKNKMSTIVCKNDVSIELDIKTLIFFDTETTGLPAEEHNKTKITELSLVAVETEHIRMGVFPRVQNKLTLCLNPRKMVSIEAEDLTGRLLDLF